MAKLNERLCSRNVESKPKPAEALALYWWDNIRPLSFISEIRAGVRCRIDAPIHLYVRPRINGVDQEQRSSGEHLCIRKFLIAMPYLIDSKTIDTPSRVMGLRELME